MSTAFHRRKARQAQHDDNHSSSGGIRHRIIMSSITDEEMADSLSESNSTEPSLANSSVSNSSFSRHDSSIQNTSSSPTTTIEESRPQQYLHCSIPLHSNSSLLDMTRDDSHDDDNNVSTTEVQRDLDRDPLYRSPDTSLLDEHDDDHDHDNDNDNDHDDAEEDAVTVVGRSFANISASISGSFCTKGDEVGNCTLPDCSTYLSDKVAASSKKVLFSDVMLKDRIMTDFNYLLGSTTAPCCSEKNLFTDCFGAVPTVVTGVEHSEEEEAKIRNRAGESWRARAYRIKRLREERMIQDSSLPKSGNLLVEDGLSLQLEDGLMRSTSFSHHHQQKRVSISKPVSMKPKQEVNVEPLGCMIGDCIEPITLMEGNELEVEWKSRQEYLDEQDLCYDSDPGLPSRLNTLTSDQKGRRAVTPDAESMKLTYERSKSDSQVNSSSPPPPPPSAPKKKWFISPRSRRRRMHFDSFDESLDNSIELDGNSHAATEREEALNLIREDFYGSENTSLDSPSSDSFEDHSLPRKIGPIGKRATTIHIDNEIRRNVQDALNETWTLTWHPTPEVKAITSNISAKNSSAYIAPRCIQLWFERGNRVRRNDIVEPKLMWRDAYHPDLASQRKLNFSTTKGPHQICLLSICRIIEARNIDRNRYPFAKKSCSFMIRTSDDEEFIFEAMNQKQRDHIVHTWKLVVARLASQAVVGDGEGMVGEFFVSSSFSVP